MSAPPLAYRRNVALLAAAQALLLVNGVTLVAINGLLGLQLAADKRLATFPVTTYVIGAALAALPAALFMKRHGRRAGFMLGAGFGIGGAALSALAVFAGSFPLLCLGTILAGCYNAFGQQYRFAAVDASPPDWRGKAISLTLAGGIVGGIIGPQVGTLTRNLWQPTYLASYAALMAFAVLALLVANRLDIPPLSATEKIAAGRPLGEIARQPDFIVALLAAVCGYATMNLLMTATPLAMDVCGLTFTDTALILQWHVIGMFAPSFFTGDLIRRFGVLPLLLSGAALLLVCIGVALAGVTLMHFWWALLLLGVGWNFLFVGGTTLLTETCRPEEKAKVQGGNDFVVLAVQGATSFAAGMLITDGGWTTLNLLALPLVVVTALASFRLWWVQRRAPTLSG